MQLEWGCPRNEFESYVITNHVLKNENQSTFVHIGNVGHSDNQTRDLSDN